MGNHESKKAIMTGKILCFLRTPLTTTKSSRIQTELNCRYMKSLPALDSGKKPKLKPSKRQT